MQRHHRRKQKKSRLGEAAKGGVGRFIIFIMCLFVVVIQALGRVVALGVATYGYVAKINIAVTVPA